MLCFFYRMWCYFIPIGINRLLILHSVILIHWKECNTCFCFKITVLTREVHALGLYRIREKQKNLLPQKPTAYTPLLHNRGESHAQGFEGPLQWSTELVWFTETDGSMTSKQTKTFKYQVIAKDNTPLLAFSCVFF